MEATEFTRSTVVYGDNIFIKSHYFTLTFQDGKQRIYNIFYSFLILATNSVSNGNPYNRGMV